MTTRPSTMPVVFNFDSRAVRTTLHGDGSIWFVAADVCAALTIDTPHDAVSKLDDDRESPPQATRF